MTCFLLTHLHGQFAVARSPCSLRKIGGQREIDEGNSSPHYVFCSPETVQCHAIFSALQGMPAWTSDEKGVRLSVCPTPSVHLSVKRMDCDKKEERSVQIFIPCKKIIYLVF